MASEVIKIVDPDNGPGTDYLSLLAFEAGERRDLVAADEIAVAEVRSSGTPDKTNEVDFDSANWTTDSTRYIHIRPYAGQEHAGVWDATKYVKQPNNNQKNIISDVDIKIEGIQLETVTTDTNIQESVVLGGNVANKRQYLNRCLIRLNESGTIDSSQQAVSLVGTNTTIRTYITNNIIYDWKDQTGTHELPAFGPTYIYNYMYNNTVVNCGSGIGSLGSRRYAYNNVVQNTTGDNYYGDFNATSYNNLSDDGTAPGNDPITGSVLFVNAAAKDFHLSLTDTVAKGAGRRSFSPDYENFYDVDGYPRFFPMDCGADQAIDNTKWKVWGGGSSMDGNYNTATCWTGDSVPTSTDYILFNGTDVTDCTIDVDVDVGGMAADWNYTGTVDNSVNNKDITIRGPISVKGDDAAPHFNWGANCDFNWTGTNWFIEDADTWVMPSTVSLVITGDGSTQHLMRHTYMSWNERLGHIKATDAPLYLEYMNACNGLTLRNSPITSPDITLGNWGVLDQDADSPIDIGTAIMSPVCGGNPTQKAAAINASYIKASAGKDNWPALTWESPFEFTWGWSEELYLGAGEHWFQQGIHFRHNTTTAGELDNSKYNPSFRIGGTGTGLEVSDDNVGGLTVTKGTGSITMDGEDQFIKLDGKSVEPIDNSSGTGTFEIMEDGTADLDLGERTDDIIGTAGITFNSPNIVAKGLALDNLRGFKSDTPASDWTLVIATSYDFLYLDVIDNDATGSFEIIDGGSSYCRDLGNNTNWTFDYLIKKDGTAFYTTLAAAIAALPATLIADASILFLDRERYEEVNTLSGVDTNGFILTIDGLGDEGVPGTGKTTLFHATTAGYLLTIQAMKKVTITDIEFEREEALDDSRHGIDIDGNNIDEIVIDRCDFRGNGYYPQQGIYWNTNQSGYAGHLFVRNCLFRRWGKAGIQFVNGGSTYNENFTSYYNTFVKNQEAIQYDGSSSNKGWVKGKNNIFDMDGDELIECTYFAAWYFSTNDWTPDDLDEMENNLYHFRTSTQMYLFVSGSIGSPTLSYASLAAMQAAYPAEEVNGLEADPLFDEYCVDYHIGSDSPAYQSADGTANAYDNEQSIRVYPYNRGCYESDHSGVPQIANPQIDKKQNSTFWVKIEDLRTSGAARNVEVELKYRRLL